MFTLIDGGFTFAMNELVTLDFSWLFCFCTMVSLNILSIIRRIYKWGNRKDNKSLK